MISSLYRNVMVGFLVLCGFLLSVLSDHLLAILTARGQIKDFSNSLCDFGGAPSASKNLIHVAIINKKPGFCLNLRFEPRLGLSPLQKLRLYAQAKIGKFATIHKKLLLPYFLIDKYGLLY